MYGMSLQHHMGEFPKRLEVDSWSHGGIDNEKGTPHYKQLWCRRFQPYSVYHTLPKCHAPVMFLDQFQDEKHFIITGAKYSTPPAVSRPLCRYLHPRPPCLGDASLYCFVGQKFSSIYVNIVMLHFIVVLKRTPAV